MIIDTHCHLDDKRYEDLDEVVHRARECGVGGVVIPAADIFDIPRAREISYSYDDIYFCAGVHPYHQKDFDEALVESYLGDARCIAVGECGLDYYRLPEDEDEKKREIEEQKRVFEAQIKLAIKHNKPLIVHVRESNQDSYDLLKKYAKELKCGGVLHCYNASELLLDLANDGFYFGIGGVITFKNEKKLNEMIFYIPKEKIILETDAPYLTPHPKRGERNEPAYTSLVASYLSEKLQMSLVEFENLTTANAKRLFKQFDN